MHVIICAHVETTLDNIRFALHDLNPNTLTPIWVINRELHRKTIEPTLNQMTYLKFGIKVQILIKVRDALKKTRKITQREKLNCKGLFSV
jgi:hypothetical protein